MKFEEFFITNYEGASNCVVRTIAKLLSKNYDEIEERLNIVANELNCNFNDIEVFEKILFDNGYHEEPSNEVLIKDLNIDDGNYAILCYDKKDYYHMVAVMNNTLYDKTSESLDLYVLKLYKYKG